MLYTFQQHHSPAKYSCSLFTLSFRPRIFVCLIYIFNSSLPFSERWESFVFCTPCVDNEANYIIPPFNGVCISITIFEAMPILIVYKGPISPIISPESQLPHFPSLTHSNTRNFQKLIDARTPQYLTYQEKWKKILPNGDFNYTFKICRAPLIPLK